MVFYQQETFLGLAIASIPALASFYAFFILKRPNVALALVLLSALLLRLLLISLDPYLNEWDERFHALVSKNMIDHPFKPMLRVDPVLEYNYKEWCCNHVWVHKQPLFLWQMAASMKLFGVNEFAMRLPSALMGTIMVYFVHQVAHHWTKIGSVAFAAALLTTFSFYQLEMISGRYGLDHNDLAFTFYVTASIWAFIRYLRSDYDWRWALLVGIFVGCAILNKWLTGILVFGGWGLYILLSKPLRTDVKRYMHIMLAVIIACVVFLPWQIYILQAFPQESAWAYEFNRLHITVPLDGHRGDSMFHIDWMSIHYGKLLLPVALIGVVQSLRAKTIDSALSVAMIAMAVVFIAFFTIAKTKMPAFTYPIASIVLVAISLGLVTIIEALLRIPRTKPFKGVVLAILLGASAFHTLQPNNIASWRSASNEVRSARMFNTKVYKSLEATLPKAHVLFNTMEHKEVDVMFYTKHIAYPQYPEEHVVDSLLLAGHQLAVFRIEGRSPLPTYMKHNEQVVVVEPKLQRLD